MPRSTNVWRNVDLQNRQVPGPLVDAVFMCNSADRPFLLILPCAHAIKSLLGGIFSADECLIGPNV